MTKARKTKVEMALQSWRAFIDRYMALNLRELKMALKVERKGANRSTIVERLVARITVVEQVEQRKKLLAKETR